MTPYTDGEQTIAPLATENAATFSGPQPPEAQSHEAEISNRSAGISTDEVYYSSEDSDSLAPENDYGDNPIIPLAARQKNAIVEPEPGIERIVVTTPLPLPPRRADIKKSIVVYYDIPEDSVEGSTDSSTRGRSGPPNTNWRPWLVQINSTFLNSCITETMGFDIETKPLLDKLQQDRTSHNQANVQLLEYLLEVIRVDLRFFLELRRNVFERKLKTISFEHIWYLFQPGSIVWSKEQGREQLYAVYEVLLDPNREGANQRSLSKSRVYNMASDDNDHSNDPHNLDHSYFGQSDHDRHNHHSGTGDLRKDTEYPPFILRCYYTVYDGSLIGPSCRDLSIPYFSGEKAVLDLPVYPVSLHPDGTAILYRFQERGRKLLSWKGHLHYEGPTLPPPHGGYTSGFTFWSDEVDQEVYADPEIGYQCLNSQDRPVMSKPQEVPSNAICIRTERQLSKIYTRAEVIYQFREESIDRKRSRKFIRSQPIGCRFVSKEKALELKGYLQLLPNQALCFIFRKRNWRYLDVDLLRQIDKSEAAAKSGFDDLVIPDTYRDLLISVIESYKPDPKSRGEGSRPKISSQMDIVRGKGRGLIILLHGPPGVGKTSTAETIAAYTKRPLYVLASGDIGLTSKDIEASLSYHFKLASSWGCIMLIDEADVFLMKRDWHDIERNALVSVFLRVLEYYSGILFLTTNRAGVIDEAFKSRMHLYLRYPSIDLNSTKLIWGKLLDRIARENKENKIKIEFDRSALLKYASEHFESHREKRTTWNARQIRNAFQTAIALSQYDRVRMLEDNGLTEEEAEERGGRFMRAELKSEYFEKIAESAKDFYSFMAGLKGGTDDQMAFEEGLRDDSFDPSERMAKKQYHGLLSRRGKPSMDHNSTM
ncbi:unnamed protein product [Clonostachys rhizophaga]|uniref:AAA+ ATPase domain-containing protein n=1 Tax=Clonostachys rhizophaga TaxID=160324 RepID=A0A9N9YWZ3_9HYPO|nr:unnamed protein product [Clonostachys rhizophaga]